MSKYLSAYFNEPKSDAQRKFVGGKISFRCDEESVKTLVKQIEEMAAIYRAIGEKYTRVDIVRNENHEKENKPEFSFVRSTYSKDGQLKEKMDAYLASKSGDQVQKAAEFEEDPFD